jgi:hypothetical protein
MKLIRVFFFIILLGAVFDVAACVVSQVNPLGSLVLVIIAGSSVVLVDYLDGPYRQRVWDLDQRRAETRMDVWARRDRDGFSA